MKGKGNVDVYLIKPFQPEANYNADSTPKALLTPIAPKGQSSSISPSKILRSFNRTNHGLASQDNEALNPDTKVIAY